MHSKTPTFPTLVLLPFSSSHATVESFSSLAMSSKEKREANDIAKVVTFLLIIFSLVFAPRNKQIP